MKNQLYVVLVFLCFVFCAKAQVENIPATIFNPQPFIDNARKNNVPDWEIEKYVKIKQLAFLDSANCAKWKKQLLPREPSPQAAGQPCDNVDFEYGAMINWNGYSGPFGNPMQNQVGIHGASHTITSGAGFDPNVGGNLLPEVDPLGGVFSFRLGNDTGAAEAEAIEQVFQVTAGAAIFSYRIAIVLEDPEHDMLHQPFFYGVFFDMNGNVIPYSTYKVHAGAGIPNFIPFQANPGNGVFLPWTTMTVDLSAYIGQDVTLHFEVSDCGYGGHFGYAYVDGNCGPIYNTINTTICKNDSFQLIGPANANSYLWSPSADTNQSIYVQQPGQYTLLTTSANGYMNQPLLFNVSLIDTSIWTNGLHLHSNQFGATYQWIDCVTNLPVVGATNQDFYPNTNGNYAVIISKDGCIDTSACKSKIVGLSSGNNSKQLVTVFPNPGNGQFTVQSDREGDYSIVNTLGQIVFHFSLSNETNFTKELRLKSGVYYISSNNGAFKQKIVAL